MIKKKIGFLIILILFSNLVLGFSNVSNKQEKYVFNKSSEIKSLENLIEELEYLEIEECQFIESDNGLKVTYEATNRMYYGTLKNNRPHGRGIVFQRYHDASGSGGVLVARLIGNFNNGYAEGFGVSYASLDKYDAKFITYLTYEGYYNNGKREGKGNLYFADSTKFEEYRSNIDNEDLIIAFNEIITIPGETLVVNNVPKLENVLLYSGEHKLGKASGHGVEYYPNGNVRYKGEFLNYTYNGKGTLYDEGGNIIYNGEFVNGDIK